MSPRLRAALYAQAGAVFSLYPCLYVGDRPTASRSRLQLFFQVMPPSVHQMVITLERNGLIRRRPQNGPKHRGAGRSRSPTGPPRQSRSTRQSFCAEVLVEAVISDRRRCPNSAIAEVRAVGP